MDSQPELLQQSSLDTAVENFSGWEGHSMANEADLPEFIIHSTKDI